MNVDTVLLLGQIAFLVALFLFLFLLAMLLRRELRSSPTLQEERAPADLLVVEPAESGLEAGERIPLLSLSNIGRDGTSDIVFDDSYVSAEHAKLIWNGRGWVLEDLDSTNGTRVNGRRIKRAVPIKSGDILEFGRIKVKLVPAA